MNALHRLVVICSYKLTDAKIELLAQQIILEFITLSYACHFWI